MIAQHNKKAPNQDMHLLKIAFLSYILEHCDEILKIGSDVLVSCNMNYAH